MTGSTNILKSSAMIAVGLFAITAARAGEVRFTASAALRPAVEVISPAFEKATGHKVKLTIANVTLMMKDPATAGFDVTIQSSADIDTLEKASLLAGGSAANLVTSSVGLGVKSGSSKPDISTAAAVKATMLAAKSVAYSAGTSGAFFLAAMEKIGVADAVKAKSQVISGSVGAVVAKGDAEIGAQQYGELLPVKGLDVLGRLPADIATNINYRLAVGARPMDEAATKALVNYLKTDAALSVLNAAGFPAGG